MRILILAILLIIALTYYFYKKSNTIIEGGNQCGGYCGGEHWFEVGTTSDTASRLGCIESCSPNYIDGGSLSGYKLNCKTTNVPYFGEVQQCQQRNCYECKKTDCPGGSERTGKGSCTPCPVNTYGSGGSSSCSPCPAYSYSPGGSSSCYAVAGAHGIKRFYQCAPGMYSSGTGWDNCVACDWGKYAIGKGNTGCRDCPADHYCICNGCSPAHPAEALNGTGAPQATQCPANTTSPAGSWLLNDCVANPGYTGSGNNVSACRVGTYKNTTGNSPCTACPAHSSSDAGSTAASSCVCDTGFTSTTSGSCTRSCGPGLKRVDDSCTPCPPGTFKTDTSTATSCTSCPPNSTTDASGSSAASSCVCDPTDTLPHCTPSPASLCPIPQSCPALADGMSCDPTIYTGKFFPKVIAQNKPTTPCCSGWPAHTCPTTTCPTAPKCAAPPQYQDTSGSEGWKGCANQNKPITTYIKKFGFCCDNTTNEYYTCGDDTCTGMSKAKYKLISDQPIDDIDNSNNANSLWGCYQCGTTTTKSNSTINSPKDICVCNWYDNSPYGSTYDISGREIYTDTIYDCSSSCPRSHAFTTSSYGNPDSIIINDHIGKMCQTQACSEAYTNAGDNGKLQLSFQVAADVQPSDIPGKLQQFFNNILRQAIPNLNPNINVSIVNDNSPHSFNPNAKISSPANPTYLIKDLTPEQFRILCNTLAYYNNETGDNSHHTHILRTETSKLKSSITSISKIVPSIQPPTITQAKSCTYQNSTYIQNTELIKSKLLNQRAIGGAKWCYCNEGFYWDTTKKQCVSLDYQVPPLTTHPSV